MGQVASGPQAPQYENLDVAARGLFSQIERHSVHQFNTSSIDALLESLRLPAPEIEPGVDIMLRSAEYFASFPNGLTCRSNVNKHLLKVIAFYNGRMCRRLGISDNEFRRHLFLSIAAATVSEAKPADEDSYYIAYDDLIGLFRVLTSVFGTKPQQYNAEYEPMKDVARRLLLSVEAPIIRWHAFEALLSELPFVQHWFSLIWDRLLFDPKSTIMPEIFPTIFRELPREITCELAARHGPSIESTLRLFKGSRDGFALRAFETHVAKWRKSTVLLVSGKSTKKDPSDLGRILSHAYDAPSVKANNIQLAVIVHQPWKMSAKYTFSDGETEILVLSPHFQVYRPQTKATGGFLTAGVGLGFGLSPPQQAFLNSKRPAPSVALALDDRMEYGAFRVIRRGDGNFEPLFQGHSVSLQPYEFRFLIEEVEVWGIGSESDLNEQRRAWEWEEREAARRQGINMDEDRALLELAGIVGQYNPDRG